jgi:hypothetical protein
VTKVSPIGYFYCLLIRKKQTKQYNCSTQKTATAQTYNKEGKGKKKKGEGTPMLRKII